MENLELSPLQDKINKNIEQSHPNPTIDKDKMVIRRNGDTVYFDPQKISIAMTKAFLAVKGSSSAASSSVREQILGLTDNVQKSLDRRFNQGNSVHIEEIQDQVELALMRSGLHDVARSYVLYREERNKARNDHKVEKKKENKTENSIKVDVNGDLIELNESKLTSLLADCAENLENIDINSVLHRALQDLYDGVKIDEVYKSLILSSRSMIETEPNYSFLTARLLLNQLIRNISGDFSIVSKNYSTFYKDYFSDFVKKGISSELLDERLATFDLKKLADAIDSNRDLKFGYLGLQTLYDRYFLHIEEDRIEPPQIFFMRVAMGLAINEVDREEKAIEFYNVLSNFDFMSSTPTLFNSGTKRPQLSSCYLTTVDDDLAAIYESVKDNALLSKYAGGLGNDWSNVRALGSHIKGTNGKSQGVVPFLKVVNDTAVAVNQGGKRKGAVCTYLETWHLDVEEFLELRKNTGDDRRRTHDMNTANWIPDLFMKRVYLDQQWTLFTPSDVPDLHGLFGKDFEKAYEDYELKAKNGEIKFYKEVSAVQLWRKMLTMLFETGHPWITFKDPCNIRSPQNHVGTVNSSNLCTEITLNTSNDEIAVCNLGSINLVNHLDDLDLDKKKISKTIRTAMRMLDNVIDINFYAVAKSRNSNLKHRPVGLGMMGFQDCLYNLDISYASEEAIKFADYCTEIICYNAYSASCDLARERGKYSSYDGSLWSKGILPLDSLDLLESEREGFVDVDKTSRLDWSDLRKKIAEFGMRNSNCTAIAPTATIANIVGVSASIEPTYQNIYVKSNLSGEFTIINKYLVAELKKLNLWDEVMISDLKYFDGSLSKIDRIPEKVKSKYLSAFEIDTSWFIECASRRQKWIDQAQSLNLYMSGASGKKLDETYKLAWIRGLKTTYYLRTLAATSVEKSTVKSGSLNSVTSSPTTEGNETKFCSIDDPECEACQ